MDTRLMFTAAASSMDSWDLENLKYLRKFSREYQHGNGAGVPLSETMEESYFDPEVMAMSYQSHVHHMPPGSGLIPRPNLEIKTTTASVHAHNGPDFLVVSPEESCTPEEAKAKANGQEQEHEDAEAINEIEEFSSFCGNTRSIPNPEAKLGENVNVRMHTSADSESGLEPFHDVTSASASAFDEQPYSLGSRPLDTCYQLDILTIRNESVLASKYPSKIPVPKSKTKTKAKPEHKTKAQMTNLGLSAKAKALRNGSDGFSSSGESSELEEGNLYNREGCLHAPPPSRAGTSVSGKNSRKRSSGSGSHKHKRLSSSSSPSCSSSSAYSSHSHSSSIPSSSTSAAALETERTAVCPFCDGVGARLPSSSSRTYYYMGENENGSTIREPSGVDAGIAATDAGILADHTDDSDPSSSSTRDHGLGSGSGSCTGTDSPPPLPRTPSPYYVRLRRDLITSYSPALCAPRNFGMDKQGQLVIDYSQNWLGLEKYIEDLKLET